MSAYSKQEKTADELFLEQCKTICLLHLVAMGELNTKSTLVDSERYWWKVKERCGNCAYHSSCLVHLYTGIHIDDIVQN